MDAAKKSVKTVISMLRPFYRFAVAAFSTGSFHESPSTNHTCHSSGLSFATTPNIKEVSNWVDGITPEGGTLYVKGIQFARDYFVNSSPPPSEPKENRLQVFLFVSDGDPTGYVEEIMAEMYNLNDAVPGVITLTYGLDVENDILKDMANNNYADVASSTLFTDNLKDIAGNSLTYNSSRTYPVGKFEKLTASDMRIKLGTFYAIPSIKEANTAVHWSLPYVDSMGAGLMVTGSKAVYSSDNILQGVVGYDITIRYLMEPVEDLVSESSYAFMIEGDHGYLLSHPMLMNPQSLVTDIAPVHYQVFENDDDIIGVVESIINGTSTSASANNVERYSIHKRDNGMNVGGQNAEYATEADSWKLQNVDIDCEKIAVSETDVNLVLCVVQESAKKILDSATYLGTSPTSDFVYHRMDLVASDTCKHGWRIAKKKEAAVKFSARQFSNPTEYLVENETETSVNALMTFLNTGSGTTNFVDGSTTRSYVFASGQLDVAWKAQDTELDGIYASDKAKTTIQIGTDVPIAVWRYYGSSDGTIRLWPGIHIAQNYDPTVRPWYRLAMTNTDKTFLSTPYLDAFGMGYVVTITRAVKLDTDAEVAGVLGTDYFVKQLGDMVKSAFDDCVQNECILIDSTGGVVYWDEMVYNVQNMKKSKEINGQKYDVAITTDDILIDSKSVTDILKTTHGIKTLKCHDTIHMETRVTLDINIAACSDQSGSTLCPLPNTNVFLFASPGKGTLNTDESKMKLKASKDDYAVCENKYKSLGAIPACQGPPAHLDISFLGAFTTAQGFANEIVTDLDNCYPWMEQWFFYALYPEGVNAASWGRTLKWIGFIVFIAIVAYFVMDCIATEASEDDFEDGGDVDEGEED